MTRLKLPAYGKKLLEARRAGNHPLDVNLCFGSLWRCVPEPKVAVMPSDFVPGIYNWTVLTGLCVTVFVQAVLEWRANIIANHLGALHTAYFAMMCVELTKADAFVIVRAPMLENGRMESRRELLLDMTLRLAGGGVTPENRPAWPSWWSDSLQKKQEMAAAVHLHDIERARGREK